jgi:hypothetical protein
MSGVTMRLALLRTGLCVPKELVLTPRAFAPRARYLDPCSPLGWKLLPRSFGVKTCHTHQGRAVSITNPSRTISSTAPKLGVNF